MMFVDMGSTYNFLGQKTIKQLGLRPIYVGQMKVRVANDQLIEVRERYEGVSWTAQGVECKTNFYVLTAIGYNTIMEWLQGLGTIAWDCKNLIMKFWHGNKKVTFHGEDNEVEVCENPRLMTSELN